MTTENTTNTDTAPTRTLEELVDAHLDAYGDPDTARRAATVRAVWAADGRLADPPMEATGHDGIAALTDVVLEHFPGHTFRRTTAVDEHHGFARYGWELVGPDGTVAVAGLDVARIDPEGRIGGIVGFFGDLAAR